MYHITTLFSHVRQPLRIFLSYTRLCRHNSADSVPTSNLVCITEVAIRTTLCIAGIKYTCDLVTDSQFTRYKNAFKKSF